MCAPYTVCLGRTQFLQIVALSSGVSLADAALQPCCFANTKAYGRLHTVILVLLFRVLAAAREIFTMAIRSERWGDRRSTTCAAPELER
jgi:hypothetical protein